MTERLRVAMIAGGLSQGGAEKQLVYAVRALLQANVEVRVFCLTRGEFHEAALRDLGTEPVWVGRFGNPLLRILALFLLLRRFRPHVIQATHGFANLYAAALGWLLGTVSLGALRGSLRYSRQTNGRWTRWLMGAPTAVLANSRSGQREVVEAGLVSADRAFFLPNVIDFSDYGQAAREAEEPRTATAVFVGRLISVKRLDRFLEGLSGAIARGADLCGMVVGEGPARPEMERLALELGLTSERVSFLGIRADITRLLAGADMLVLTSDEEGFPNVILEAMAARLPVVTTPAGEAPLLVQDGVTGFVVPFDAPEQMAERLERLARSPRLRRQMGEAGRQRLERGYGLESLAQSLLSVYREVAQATHKGKILRLIAAALPRIHTA